ncbi:hypothetical protein E5S69_20720 [Cupriavidus necator]|uniref:hypothetical protein n=1 Tax=Cupriavidus necator TaxID=106590 RepID=UPI00148F7B0F|nr:hypothetical protein [Cupriavidus necator]NOV25929.1 hypothetical protein [Cupriavidus necator]
MNLTHLTFDFDGHTVYVLGYHYAGYSGNASPPEPESFTVTKIEIVKQAYPDEPVAADELDEDALADAALRAWRDREEYYKCEHADAVREDRWMESRGYL